MSTSRRIHFVSVGESNNQRARTNIETIQFAIHNFRNRNEGTGEYIISPVVKVLGHEWCIRLYPNTYTDGKHMSCFLHLRDTASIDAEVSFRVKGGFYKEGLLSGLMSSKIQIGIAMLFRLGKVWCAHPFLEREQALEKSLDEDGSLIIEVDIRVNKKDQQVWYPKLLIEDGKFETLRQETSSKIPDVVFSVGDALFKVHKSVLSLRAPKLYEIATACDDGDNDDDSSRPIQIPYVKKEIFASLVDFLYTANFPEIENERFATDLLVAADCYDCVHLKLYAESIIADKFLKADNSAELLVFADSYSCALLKEAATNVLINNAGTIVKSTKGWSQIKESHKLLSELIDSTIPSDCYTGDIDEWDVKTLREALEEENLPLDGSREVLIDRLKTNTQLSTKMQLSP